MMKIFNIIHTKLPFLLFILIAVSSTAKSERIDFIVSLDGKGDFISVQSAINAVPDLRKNRTNILIKPGVYKEKLTIPSTKSNISFIGEDPLTTVLSFDDFADRKNIFGESIGTSSSSSLFLYGDGFEVENISFANSAGPVGQAVAIRIDGDKAKFVNCRFLGNQDTLYLHGKKNRAYFKKCYIEGTVDFIFGWSTALFEDCDIFCKSPGYITAASTEKEVAYGFVFKNCKITGSAPDHSVYLGRPWRPYAKTVFISCYLDRIVNLQGWDDWGNAENEKTASYAEYSNSGPGADPKSRVEWMNQLSESEVSTYKMENILTDWTP